MKNILFPVSAIALAVHVANANALEALDDDSLAGVSGQSGLTLEFNPGDLEIADFAYTQDETSINFKDLAILGAGEAPSVVTVDIDADGVLNIDGQLANRAFTVGGVGMTGSTGVTGEFFSLRGRTLAYNDMATSELGDDTGVFRLNIGDDNGDIKLDGSQVGLFFDSLHFGDDGLEWIIDDLVMSATINYGRLIVDGDSVELYFGDPDSLNPNQGARLVYDAKAIGLAAGSASDGVPDENFAMPSQTFGSLRLDLDAYGSLTLKGGGQFGEGITFIPSLTLYNESTGNSDDRPAFRYEDDGYVILAKGFRGDFRTESGLTLDFETDVDSQEPYLALRYSDLDFEFSLDDLVLGQENGASLGSFKGQILFRDDVDNNRLNYQKFYPGGRIGSQGLRVDVGWNIVSAKDPNGENGSSPLAFEGKTALESNTYFAMNDDNNWVFFNGFNGYGSGTVTFDLTSGPRNYDAVVANATTNAIGGYYNNPYDPTTGTFAHVDVDNNDSYVPGVAFSGPYEGLRIGFEDLQGEYSFAGVTVGTSEEEAMDAPYMGGTELLLAMEVFPAYSFTLNGNLTIAPGGQLDGNGESGGSQGLTINGDLLITNGNAALTVNETGRGVWLTDVTYDIHMRGASLDVTEDGLTFNKGLTWSTIQVGKSVYTTDANGERQWSHVEGGIIFGSKDEGENLGVFTLERLEDGTTIAVKSGGAGMVCIGGGTPYSLGGSAGGCAIGDTNGDSLINEDDTQVLGARFENRGEQGLEIKVNAKFAEGSDDPSSPYFGKGNRFSWTQPNGTTITLDNFSTQDGPLGGNDYGLNIDLKLDVARTAVRNEDGNLVKLVDGEYVEFDEDAGDSVAENGPLGFAVLGRVHFKQLNIDGLKLAATPDATPQTLISEVVIQNADIQANLTATPIR